LLRMYSAMLAVPLLKGTKYALCTNGRIGSDERRLLHLSSPEMDAFGCELLCKLAVPEDSHRGDLR
jgi:hypothetical protein